MKYDYHFERVKLANGSESLVIRLGKHIELIETFLIADIQNGGRSYDWVMEKFNEVLDGTSENSSIQGNICRLEIKTDFTRVVDTLNNDVQTNHCIIETPELIKLIGIWVAENKRVAM